MRVRASCVCVCALRVCLCARLPARVVGRAGRSGSVAARVAAAPAGTVRGTRCGARPQDSIPSAAGGAEGGGGRTRGKSARGARAHAGHTRQRGGSAGTRRVRRHALPWVHFIFILDEGTMGARRRCPRGARRATRARARLQMPRETPAEGALAARIDEHCESPAVSRRRRRETPPRSDNSAPPAARG